MYKEMLKGVLCPMTTPFINEELNMLGLEHNIELLNTTDLKGYFALGTNGEFKTLSENERKKIVGFLVKKASKDKVVIAGAGMESTKETIRNVEIMSDLGADIVSLIMPCFFKNQMTNNVIIKHIVEVADNSKLPILLYNNPKVSAGVGIDNDVIKKVKEHDNIIGLKDSSKEMWKYSVEYESEKFSILAGSMNSFFELLKLGGTGGVLSLANILPEPCTRLYKLYKENKDAEAFDLNEKLKELNYIISGVNGVSGVKFAMDISGFRGGTPRLPLEGINEREKDKIKDGLFKSNFFKTFI